MKKNNWFVMMCVLAVMLILAACSSDETSNEGQSSDGEKDSTKVAVVFATGGLGDQSFNDNAYAGVERAKEELDVTYDYVEPTQISEFETFHREFAQAGDYELIIGVGFDQVDAIQKVAGEFPEQKFLLIDSVAEAPNVASAVFEANEGAFLAGAIAGQKTETDKLGFVGGMDIPLINEFAAGYIAGAKYVNENVDVSINYVGNWSDPNTGKEMSVSMYDAGADIVYAAAGGSGVGVFNAAEEKGKMSIGADMVPSQIPDFLLVTTLKKIDNVIFDQVKYVLEDTWEPGILSLGVAEDAVGYMVEGSNIETPQEYIDAAEELKEKIINGEISVPTELGQVDAFIAEK